MKKLTAEFVEKRDLAAGQVSCFNIGTSKMHMLPPGTNGQILSIDFSKSATTLLSWIDRNAVLDFDLLAELVLGDPARTDVDKYVIYDGAATDYRWINRDNITGGNIQFPGASLAADQAGCEVGSDTNLTEADDRYLLEVSNANKSLWQFMTNKNLYATLGGIFTGGPVKSGMLTWGNQLEKDWTGVLSGVYNGTGVTSRFNPDLTSSGLSFFGLRLQCFWEDAGTYAGSVSQMVGAQFEAELKRDAVGASVTSLIGCISHSGAALAFTNAVTISGTIAHQFQLITTGSKVAYGNAVGIDVQTPGAMGAGSTMSSVHGIKIRDQHVTGAGWGVPLLIEPQSWNSAGLGNLYMSGGDWNNGHLQLNTGHIWHGAGALLRAKNASPWSVQDGRSLAFDAWSGYEAGTTVLSGGAITVDIDTVSKTTDLTLGTPVYTLATGEVTVARTGTFEIEGQVSAKVTGVGDTDPTQIEVWIERFTAAAWAEVAGTRGLIFCYAEHFGGTAAMRIMIDLVSGDKIRMRGDRTQGTSAVSTRANGARLTIREI